MTSPIGKPPRSDYSVEVRGPRIERHTLERTGMPDATAKVGFKTFDSWVADACFRCRVSWSFFFCLQENDSVDYLLLQVYFNAISTARFLVAKPVITDSRQRRLAD